MGWDRFETEYLAAGGVWSGRGPDYIRLFGALRLIVLCGRVDDGFAAPRLRRPVRGFPESVSYGCRCFAWRAFRLSSQPAERCAGESVSRRRRVPFSRALIESAADIFRGDANSLHIGGSAGQRPSVGIPE
jgi:hypothetical protein